MKNKDNNIIALDPESENASPDKLLEKKNELINTTPLSIKQISIKES